MSEKYYIGIDNGVTGSIGIVGRMDGFIYFGKTPVKKEQDYTKAKKNITRIDSVKLKELLIHYKDRNCLVLLERPMVNPKMFLATTSALRAWEATIVVLETLGLPYVILDSKEWQKELLPKGVRGEELKTASKTIGCRVFPSTSEHNHADRDGLLIAEYGRRKGL